MRRLVEPFADPDGRGGGRQHEGGQPPRPAGALAAHRLRDRIQPRPPPLRHAPLHADGSGRGRGVPAPGDRRGWRLFERDAGGGHGPDDRDRPRRLEGRLRRGRAWLDRDPCDALRPLAPALSMVLRDASGGLEASLRALAARARQGRPSRPALPDAVPDRPALPGAADRRLRPVRRRLPRSAARARLLARIQPPPARSGRLRVPPRPRAAAAALGAAHAAVRLPSADVPGRRPGDDQRGARRPPAVAARGAAAARSRSPAPPPRARAQRPSQRFGFSTIIVSSWSSVIPASRRAGSPRRRRASCSSPSPLRRRAAASRPRPSTSRRWRSSPGRGTCGRRSPARAGR